MSCVCHYLYVTFSTGVDDITTLHSCLETEKVNMLVLLGKFLKPLTPNHSSQVTHRDVI